MNNQLKEALKLISDKCKETNYHEQMKSKSLTQRISTLRGSFVGYVDTITINYCKTLQQKQTPGYWDDDQYTPTELTNRERANAINEMEIFIRDIEACIAHLKNN